MTIAEEAPPAESVPPAVDTAASEITGGRLRDLISRLSSDELEGRGPATDGDRRTRALLLEQLKELGYQPGGPNGQWEQPFVIVGVSASVPPL